jgi:hypothetical protein
MDYEEKLLNELTHIKHKADINSGQHIFLKRIFKDIFFFSCCKFVFNVKNKYYIIYLVKFMHG